MPARYTVYCNSSVAHLTPQEIFNGIRRYDLRTIAENDEVPDVAIDDAMRQLRMENADASGFRLYRLCFRPEGLRQVDIDRWPSQAEVRAVANETLGDLQSAGHSALPELRTHLGSTVDIVSATYGYSEEETIAPTLAYQVIRWLAANFAGIIRAPDHTWWKLGPHDRHQEMG